MAEPVTEERVGNLVNQIRWVTRISVALSSVADTEDVYSVVLAGLLSPLGLGYSRALLFVAEGATSGELHGRFAIGYRNQQEFDEVRTELLEEYAYLTRRRSENEGRPDASVDTGELRNLELASVWVTLIQRLGTEGPVTDALRGVTFRVSGAPAYGAPDWGIVAAALQSRGPVALSRNEAEGLIPPEVLALLDDTFAALPLVTKKGLRSVIFLDRRFAPGPIGPADLEALDWFATQGALAIQNTELVGDLERALQELKAVDQLKTNFLSIISHELRTPLTAITGFVELVLNERAGPIGENQRNLLTRVAKNTGHLSNMVNDLIEIAEIEAEGMQDVTLEPVDPLETLFATLPKLEYRRRDKTVEVEPIFDGHVPLIMCDERLLERIYFHLLDNAMKFSPKDRKVYVVFKPEADRRLAIGIRDEGIGIPRDKLQRIFDQFYQIDNSLTRSHEGLGLGLSVTRMLVQSTHGEIRVDSSVGGGSTFWVVYELAPSVVATSG